MEPIKGEALQVLQTPFFLIDQNKLDSNFYRLEKALDDHWGNFVIGYSYKTNALPWVAAHFNDLGCYAEVVSDDEYGLARALGVNKSRIIYNGPIKTKETFIEALQSGAVVNIDSQREIDWLDELKGLDQAEYQIGLRVNFDVEAYCPGQSQCAEEGGRFGFCYENGAFAKALTQVTGKGFRVRGLHLHTSSKTRGLDIYRAIAEVACQIAEEYSMELSYVDIGGGFFGGLPTKPQFAEYMELVGSILRKCFCPEKTCLIVEPGMAVVGAPVSYVTSVIDVKDTSCNRFVVTDGSRMDIDPLMTKSSYFHSFIRTQERAVAERQVICGYTCMEHDRLFVVDKEPELQAGDKIIYDRVGAYTMCLSPLFIKYFPAVYLYNGESYRCVRQAWSPAEYLQKSFIKESEHECIDFECRNSK